MTEKLKLSEEMGACRKGWVLTAETIQGWVKAAQQLESKLASAAHSRDYNAEIIRLRNAENYRLQNVNTKITDENINLRGRVDELSRSTPECVKLKARIKDLEEELRISKLETLAALNSKRDSDTAWQKEADELREHIRENDVAWQSLVTRLKQQLAAAQAVLPQPQPMPETITLGGTARGCGGAGLQQHNERDTMKRALQTALDNGTWLSSELLVDAVLMELFPQPGKRLEDIPVPQATRPAAALSFEEVTEPVIEWLNAHHNPHVECRIEVDGAWLMSTETCHPTTKFIKD